MSLTDTLRVQHGVVSSLIERLDTALSTGDEVAALSAISSLRQELQRHLGLEDAMLYPALAGSLAHREASETGAAFSDEMARLSGELGAFLNFHARSLSMEKLAAAWPSLRGRLADRIHAEERELYPLYDSLHRDRHT